jgi:hypothetical protein
VNNRYRIRRRIKELKKIIRNKKKVNMIIRRDKRIRNKDRV